MKIELVMYLQYAVFAIEVFLIMWAANKVYDFIYGSNEPVLDGNTAVAIQRLGMSLGCIFAMVSAMEHVRSDGPMVIWLNSTTGGSLPTSLAVFLATAISVVAAGSVATLFVLIASFVNDKFITYGIRDNDEVRKGNHAVAFVDAGAAIATGHVTAASFSGSGPWEAVAAFFVLGQLALVLTARIYIHYAELELEWLKRGNVAAGISLAGMLIATGITLRNAISGSFVGWQEDLSAFAASYLIGMATLFAVAHFFPKIFFGHSIHGQIRSGNAAFAAFIATMTVILALAISVVTP